MFAGRAAAVLLWVANPGSVAFELASEVWEPGMSSRCSSLPAEAEIPGERDGHARQAVRRIIPVRSGGRGDQATPRIKRESFAQ